MICLEVQDFEVDERDEIHFLERAERSDFEVLKIYFLSFEADEDARKMLSLIFEIYFEICDLLDEDNRKHKKHQKKNHLILKKAMKYQSLISYSVVR